MRRIRRLLIAVAVTAVPLATPATTHASEQDSVYVVRPGDSLYGIAHRLQVPVTTLLTENGLQITSVILPGQRLSVPGGAGTGASAGGSSSSRTAGGTAGSYTVRSGDYLSGIAARHKVSLRSLLDANDLSITSYIHPGQRLALPAGATGSGAGNATTARQASSSSSGASAQSYTVRPGDSLSGIAARHDVSLRSLLSANRLSIESYIHPGQRLALPAGASTPAGASSGSRPRSNGGAAATGASYTIRAGDTLMSIAARHDTSLRSLLDANDIVATSLILPGQELALPAGATPPTAVNNPTNTSTSTGNSRIDAVVDYALAQQGKRYSFFTKGPDAFDCSGLTLAAYARAGVSLIHYSAGQARQGQAVDFSKDPIRAGDLIFMKRRGSEVINHVGMAISSTRWIQAIGPGQGVRVGPIPSKASITTVRRIIPG